MFHPGFTGYEVFGGASTLFGHIKRRLLLQFLPIYLIAYLLSRSVGLAQECEAP